MEQKEIYEQVKERLMRYARIDTQSVALSFRGLPCPNLSAGYENAHGRFEYVPIRSMVKNVEILLNLCENAIAYAKEA